MAPSRRKRSTRRSRSWWAEIELEDLLDVRLSDLGLGIDGTALRARLDRLDNELAHRGVRFRPHVWLSTDWFTPDGVPGFAIPFFLAQRRLARIEHRHMLEVEGGTLDWCMKLLRHETGHAIDNAYRLHWRKRWRETFGRFSQPYSATYQPRPSSKRFVQNLDYWYSQSHPAEDWAECFAVWLRSGSQWRKRYAGWPVIAKLEFVDEVMNEIADQPARVWNRRRVDSLPQLSITLREYYERKQSLYELAGEGVYDGQLRRLFSDEPGYARRPTGASFLRKNSHQLRTRVASVTGQYRYVVQQALREMIAGCKKDALRLTRSERDTKVGAAILLTAVTMSFVHGRKREFLR